MPLKAQLDNSLFLLDSVPFFLKLQKFPLPLFRFFFLSAPPPPKKKKKQKKGMWLYSLFLFSLFSPNLVMFNLLHGQTLKINITVFLLLSVQLFFFLRGEGVKIAYYFTLWSFIQSNFFELLIITSMCIGF